MPVRADAYPSSVCGFQDDQQLAQLTVQQENTCYFSSITADLMSRPSRRLRGGGAYVPPHLRGSSSSTTVPGRTLDELAQHSMHIRIEFTPGGPFLLVGCPDNVLEQDNQQLQLHHEQQQQGHTSTGPPSGPPLSCCMLDSPACPDEYQIRQLLFWFQAASSASQPPGFPSGDTGAVLSLPAHLSKRERAIWHGTAQKLGLQSASTGVGDARFLQIRPCHWQPAAQPGGWQTLPLSSSQTSAAATAATAPAAAAAAAAGDASAINPSPKSTPSAIAAADPACAEGGSNSGSSSPRMSQTKQNACGTGPSRDSDGQQRQNKKQRQKDHLKVKQVWLCCQAEGGALEKYSQGEVRELLQAGTAAYPPEFAAVIRKREAAADLVNALQRRDEAAALALLAQSNPQDRLGWVRDIHSGAYPAHIAAWQGLGDVLMQLVSSHGVQILQQRDAARSTAATVAQKHGHKDLAEQLEQLRLDGLNHSSITCRPDTSGSGSSKLNGGSCSSTTTSSTARRGTGCTTSTAAAVNTAGAGRGFGREFGRGRGRQGGHVLGC